MTDFNGYTIAYSVLYCDDCDKVLLTLGGQVTVNTVLSVIGKHDWEKHSD